MGPGSLRCRFYYGPRRRSATRSVRGFVCVFETRNPRARRRLTLALRLRSGSLPRFPRVEDMVHAESLRHPGDRIGDFADVLAGSLPGTTDQEHTGTRTPGTGGTEHCLFSLPRG